MTRLMSILFCRQKILHTTVITLAVEFTRLVYNYRKKTSKIQEIMATEANWL